ncbi:hypothetical protein B0O99DRAFT_684822 [Bisporella sp. PMI_857]|nr:hypothetical protein B0O99DRAFT_684822 [Bisporella sp. PMI_857]
MDVFDYRRSRGEIHTPLEPENIDSLSPEDSTCPICFTQYDRPMTMPIRTRCGHLFCRACLETAMKGLKVICPLCRGILAERIMPEPGAQPVSDFTDAEQMYNFETLMSLLTDQIARFNGLVHANEYVNHERHRIADDLLWMLNKLCLIFRHYFSDPARPMDANLDVRYFLLDASFGVEGGPGPVSDFLRTIGATVAVQPADSEALDSVIGHGADALIYEYHVQRAAHVIQQMAAHLDEIGGRQRAPHHGFRARMREHMEQLERSIANLREELDLQVASWQNEWRRLNGGPLGFDAQHLHQDLEHQRLLLQDHREIMEFLDGRAQESIDRLRDALDGPGRANFQQP